MNPMNKIGGLLNGLNIIKNTSSYDKDGCISEWTEANKFRKVKFIANRVLSHYKEYHTSIVCPYCKANNNIQEEDFSTTGVHITRIVDEVRSFTCTSCNKTFSVKTELYPLYQIYDCHDKVQPYKGNKE